MARQTPGHRALLGPHRPDFRVNEPNRRAPAENEPSMRSCWTLERAGVVAEEAMASFGHVIGWLTVALPFSLSLILPQLLSTLFPIRSQHFSSRSSSRHRQDSSSIKSYSPGRLPRPRLRIRLSPRPLPSCLLRADSSFSRAQIHSAKRDIAGVCHNPSSFCPLCAL